MLVLLVSQVNCIVFLLFVNYIVVCRLLVNYILDVAKFEFASPKVGTAIKRLRRLASTALFSLLSIMSKSFTKKFILLITFSIFVNFNGYKIEKQKFILMNKLTFT